MSPEQAEVGRYDIDTRSDVYSLGVVLYELATGSTPLVEDASSKSSYVDMLKRVREEEPAPPSSRARHSGNSAEIAQRRSSDPARYPALLHGELDWIVMKALEKERARRYETANGLARDLERYLAGEPLEAAPASATYRVRKLVRKHRAWLVTAAAFITLLIAGVIVSSWMAIRATRAEREALRQRNVAESVSDFLQNDVLAQASANTQAGPAIKPDPDLKVRTALDRAAARIYGQVRGTTAGRSVTSTDDCEFLSGSGPLCRGRAPRGTVTRDYDAANSGDWAPGHCAQPAAGREIEMAAG